MNYITHLNHWNALVEQNHFARPTHISLYYSLFQLWNKQHFADTIFITRYDLMKMSKIGSKTTYSKCIAELHSWGWLHYSPSHSIYTKSQVRMTKWNTQKTLSNSSPKNITTSEPLVVLPQSSSYNPIHNNNSPSSKYREPL